MGEAPVILRGSDYLSVELACMYCHWRGEVGDMPVASASFQGKSQYCCPNCREVLVLHEGPLLSIDDVMGM